MKKSISTIQKVFIFTVRLSIIITLICFCLFYIHAHNIKQLEEEKSNPVTFKNH